MQRHAHRGLPGEVVLHREWRGMTVRIAGFDSKDAGEGVTLYRARIAEETAPPAAGDVAAYRAGRITITPLALDRTDRTALRAVRWATHAGV